MLELTKVSVHGEDITVLGPYNPYRTHIEMGGDRNNYPSHSGRILDLKDCLPKGIDYFIPLRDKLKITEAITIVPSHDPAKTTSGLALLVAKLTDGQGYVDASGCLVRHTKIQKLASGGDRSKQVHLDSIRVANTQLIEGRRVLLIDDVMTSGNSLIACKSLLLTAGAAHVTCLALGRTT